MHNILIEDQTESHLKIFSAAHEIVMDENQGIPLNILILLK
jgi:hypothetical protein